MTNALVLGGWGALGTAVSQQLADDGMTVHRTSRAGDRPDTVVVASSDDAHQALLDGPRLGAVVWAHGENINDTVTDLDLTAHRRLLETNVVFASATLAALLAAGRLEQGARLVLLSSVWQQTARPGKFSYTVTKAAIGGFVRAAATDLAPQRMLVNAVLPGVVDTPMTRAMLDEQQLDRAGQATGFGRLVDTSEVAHLVSFLCSPANTGVTGQSIAVDLGFSVARSL